MLLIGLFGFPISFTVFRNLHDRGYSISKYASLLIISFISWILGHLGIEFIKTTLWLVTIFYFTVGVIFFFLKREEIIAYLKKYMITLLVIELVFIISFGFFLKIASFNGSIVVEPGTEAMMDYMMIQSVLKSKVFPQWDLWFAGEKVNYYYYGWVNVAALKLLSGIDLPVVFNAAIGLVYALIFTSAFGLGFNFSKKYRYGLLTSLLMVVIGNLNGFVQVIGPRKFFQMDWFQCARVIDGTINEFPYFSLMYGDLHSYVLAFPVAFICLFISLNLLFEKDKLTLFAKNQVDNILTIIFYTITFGSLIPTNTWDYPAYFMLFFVSIFIRNFSEKDMLIKEKIKKTLIPSILLFTAGLIAYSPYFAAFKQKREIKLVSYSRSNFSDFFQIFGTYMTITLILMLIIIHSRLNANRKKNLMFTLFILSSVIIVFHQITFLYLTAFILSGLFIICGFFFSRRSFNFNTNRISSEENEVKIEKKDRYPLNKSFVYITALAILACSYGLWCEFFYINDHYSGKLERMNTIFKIYLQMWFIWSAAGAFGTYVITKYMLKNKKKFIRYSFYALILIFISMGMVYPISSTYTRTGRFHNDSTLKGLKRASKIHSRDYKAIVWMQENIEGLPVILESCGNAYSWDSRFATFGGFPTILGWANHEAGWRNSWEEVNRRWADINAAYQSPDILKTIEILDKYIVKYVIVGSLERKNFPASSLSKFKDFMKVVYNHDGVKIYERK